MTVIVDERCIEQTQDETSWRDSAVLWVVPVTGDEEELITGGPHFVFPRRHLRDGTFAASHGNDLRIGVVAVSLLDSTCWWGGCHGVFNETGSWCVWMIDCQCQLARANTRKALTPERCQRKCACKSDSNLAQDIVSFAWRVLRSR